MRDFRIVDVFSDHPFLGNPVGVILDAEGLSAVEMQRIARWTNLSETTFALPPTVAGADYRLRIFTPRSELPFAGHPTLGSAHALVSAGRLDGARPLVQQCGAGNVVIVPTQSADVSRYRLQLPKPTLTDIDAAVRTRLLEALGRPLESSYVPLIIDVGPKWLVAKMASAHQLLELAPDFTALAELERSLGITGVTLYADLPDGIEVRSFAPSQGVDEDPVCGSGNGAVAVFRQLRAEVSLGATYWASQGQCVGRRGRVDLEVTAEGAVWVGGACVTSVTGSLAR